jgi:hypothetical protein
MINTIIGSGIFGLPSELTHLLGRASPLAMLIGAFAMATMILCMAEVASQFFEAGGRIFIFGLHSGVSQAYKSGGSICWPQLAVAQLVQPFLLPIWLRLCRGYSVARTALLLFILIAIPTAVNYVGVRSGARLRIVWGLAATGTFLWAAALSGGATVIIYSGMCAALIRLRQRRPQADALRIPFGRTLAVVGILIALALLTQLRAREAPLMAVTALMYRELVVGKAPRTSQAESALSYFLLVHQRNALLVMAWANGFFSSGQFAWMTIYLPELFPTRVRGHGDVIGFRRFAEHCGFGTSFGGMVSQRSRWDRQRSRRDVPDLHRWADHDPVRRAGDERQALANVRLLCRTLGVRIGHPRISEKKSRPSGRTAPKTFNATCNRAGQPLTSASSHPMAQSSLARRRSALFHASKSAAAAHSSA